MRITNKLCCDECGKMQTKMIMNKPSTPFEIDECLRKHQQNKNFDDCKKICGSYSCHVPCKLRCGQEIRNFKGICESCAGGLDDE